MLILDIAVPCPLRRSFDYLPPENATTIQAGMRVLVPFGNRRLVAVVLGTKQHSQIASNKLKAAVSVLDTEPTLSPDLLALGRWAANYYHHPIGEVLQQMLPVRLRRENPPREQVELAYSVTDSGREALATDLLKRAKKQAALLSWLSHQESASRNTLKQNGYDYPVIKALLDKGYIAASRHTAKPVAATPAKTLNQEQLLAVNAITEASKQFQPFLLQGVTGSGKTEVYLQAIEHCAQSGRQALVLVPEIGLTPQTLRRFEARFPGQVCVLHSGLADGERLTDWQRAARGDCAVLIGTRSAVFAPFRALGLIIIDEEHDPSYKQQDGFRYSARDIAVKRAADHRCPVVLGSATPSLESLHNVNTGKYHRLQLTQRAGGASAPTIKLLDIRNSDLNNGLAPQSMDAIADTLARGEQALVFLNRRGYSPLLQCHACGWVGQCDHCDVSLTVHFGRRQLRCHHCDAYKPLPDSCPSCKNHSLTYKGPGTERLEQTLKTTFINTQVIRIDRDTTSGKGAMRDMVNAVNEGKPCILVGTQMLAKGHHFPLVTLVIMLDIDGGLFSPDFRGAERAGQLLTQVAGRAGRAQRKGTVLIQTHAPDHPILGTLVRQDYDPFAEQLLAEREQLGLPPCSHTAVIRAEANSLEACDSFLQAVRRGTGMPGNDAQFIGPLPAPIARKANRYRCSLILLAEQRKQLHTLLNRARAAAEPLKPGFALRWTIDVDPLEWF
ncbi:primosomal protein N' [Litorivivens sp.]|uniref:primosomal protein N' n=1 Tax=Litorivivens sp. TaxID=2020868 RepID=UPI003569144C